MLGKGLPKGQGHGDGLNGEWQRTVYQEVLWAVPASMMSHHHQMMLTVQQKSTPFSTDSVPDLLGCYKFLGKPLASENYKMRGWRG